MQALKAGPAAHGWVDDQRWTLARVADLVGRLFGVGYTLRGVSYLLRRIGSSSCWMSSNTGATLRAQWRRHAARAIPGTGMSGQW